MIDANNTSIDRHIQRRQWLGLIVFCLFTVLSCFGALYPRDLLLQHSPTVVLIALMPTAIRHQTLSMKSYGMIMGFFTLHVIGARYIYSYVPYDRLCSMICGTTLSEFMGWKRNHYDRLVHFSYGLLWTYPVYEFLQRRHIVTGTLARYFAIEFVVATGALYELGEWFVAILFAPDWADRYLGQQGDIWDAQKDMALETLGALIALVWCRPKT